ncbi:MAG: glycosyltransferase [Pseudomonadota bacterium]
MKIANVTDAWHPQTNGVVTTLSRTCEIMNQNGFDMRMFTPEPYRTIPCPSYPEIRLSLFAGRRLRRALDQFAPHAIHISTEGPLGLAARRYCIRNGLAFTTSYHTQFPAYIAKRFPIPESWSYRFVRWFHNRGTATLVPTPAVRDELLQRSFNNPVPEWLGSVGISPKDDVVVYDETGFFSAPRVWFLMKALGHQHVRVLDRGLQGWKEEGGELTAKVPTVTPSSYPLSDNLAWPVVERRAVQAAIEGAADIQIADARPRGRFEGQDPEPRPGLPSGHMPGAYSVPYADLVNLDGSFKSVLELDSIFSSAGLQKDSKIFVTCGSGVSACVLALGLAEAGWTTGTQLYDGSWIDWASQPDAEIVSK